MSAAAVANGGGVAAGSVVAVAQSVAVTGIGAAGAAKVGVGAYAAAEVADRVNCYFKDENEDK